MASTRSRGSRRGIAWLVVVAGHALLLAIALQARAPATRETEARDGDSRLQVVWLPAPRMVAPRRPTSAEAAESRPVVATSRPHGTVSPDGAALPSPQAVTVPEDSPRAPRIDWQAAAERVAAGAANVAVPRRFGMPAAKPAPARAPEFGWDRSHTERVRPIDGGGIAVMLGENCVLAFAPLPVFGCVPGRREARGDLFDGMRDPDRPDGSVPETR